MDSELEQQRLLIDQSIEPSPPPFDPLKPATPISYPLKTLEELESRSYFKSFHYPFNIASTPLPTYSSLAPSRPRILVCHDMAGGYGDDKWVQGGTNEGAYAIWHWYLIDIFVYFSHSLVTIPPPCWINTAHKHGVKVLGTFITEWDEGRAICNTLLLTKESAEMYAERLTELAVALGFDGWLINMEVKLDAGQIPNLKVFVNHLTQTMHSSMPGSLVIWYDSVTVDGNLDWQNQLNDKNKPFFDLSDGIFINYTWQEDYPKLSAAVAGDRKFDVYMGIDVWGRNTYGGGQWTTNVALDVLKKDDVSAAIFAPAWVYESKQLPDFQTAQNRWWGLVEKSWGILNYYPKLLPFYSNFDQGHGYHFSVDGQQVSNDPWCNISCQSFQPVIDNSVGSSPDTIQVMVNFKDASFSGGGNLTFKGILEDHAYYTTGIFRGELPLDDVPIHFTYSVKSDGSSLLGLSLEFLSDDNKKTSILLAYDCMNELASKFDKVAITRQLNARDAQAGEGWILQESSISMKGYTLTQIHIVCYKSKLELNNLKLKQARKLGGTNLAQAGPSEFFASLGHITIKTPDQNSDFPPSTSWVVEGQNVSWTTGSSGSNALSIKIVWSLKEGDSSRFPTYNIFVVKQGQKVLEHQDDPISKVNEEYISVARVRTVYISDLVVPPGILYLKFIIQVCGPDGDCQKLDSCPALLVGVKGQ
ncbi:Cytosolic endo-beta-n-acetylglucosaminidase [Thalictrum thalictroides]|uniref:mannosyl-glycoprotein endo-beta-N-acetylglucosaminidase n=1 Tax=Thalictrum thalictroides TaxID=46969 RepID=A0A7J6WPK7_THATH|nr:Cytosolic endo-beta-n-acetylglucosaminidase [Thalictrum thalictroides]